MLTAVNLIASIIPTAPYLNVIVIILLMKYYRCFLCERNVSPSSGRRSCEVLRRRTAPSRWSGARSAATSPSGRPCRADSDTWGSPGTTWTTRWSPYTPRRLRTSSSATSTHPLLLIIVGLCWLQTPTAMHDKAPGPLTLTIQSVSLDSINTF